MNEDFENMKYGDLRKYAKNLGLPNVGKKDFLIQLIKEHLEKNAGAGASGDVVVVSKNDEKVEEIEEKAVEVQLQEPQTDKVKGKRGRKKGKTKKDEDEENETHLDQPVEVQQTPIAPQKVEEKPAEPQVKEEKQSKRGANKKLELPIETPKNEQPNPATPLRSKRVANKKEQIAVTAAPVVEPPPPQPTTPPKPEDSKKGENKRESPITSTEEPDEQTTTTKTKKIRTKKGITNKKVNEKPAINEQQVPEKEHKQEPAVINNEVNASLISNDQQIKSNESLITNDDSTINPANTTTTVATAVNNNQTETTHKNLDKTYDCPKLPMVVSTPLVSKELNSTYDKENKMMTDLENTGKVAPAGGGGRARIVVPKEKERVAGPRIVIPPEAVESQKKPVKVDNKKPKVVKPDFKAIHKKQEDKLESIDNYEKRKVERHESLTGKKVIVVPKKVLAEKADNLQPKDDPSPVELTSTNEVTKQTTLPQEAASQPQQQTTSGIPKLIKKQDSVTNKSPKTPRRTSIIKQSSITTPNTVRKSAQKPRMDITKTSNNNNNLNTSISTQLSSFSRRKSFDINASLARPLKYNPHGGRIRPVNFDSNSIFINKHKQQQQQANLNSSVLSTTIQQQQKPSRTSIIIKNKDSIKDMLHDQLKNNQNAAKEKFKANEIKIRKEQRKDIQMSNRNMDN